MLTNVPLAFTSKISNLPPTLYEPAVGAVKRTIVSPDGRPELAPTGCMNSTSVGMRTEPLDMSVPVVL